jgi:YgiT-type zinc finger domain-containing protein
MKRANNICVICNGQTIWTQTTYEHKLNSQKLIITDFPTETCLSCGEKYYHAKDLKDADNSVLQSELVTA